jgi:hypothetical protein
MIKIRGSTSVSPSGGPVPSFEKEKACLLAYFLSLTGWPLKSKQRFRQCSLVYENQ